MSFLKGVFRPADVNTLEAKRDVRGLRRALSSEDRSVRQAAIEALGRLGDERAAAPLIAAMKAEPALSTAALVKIGAPAVEPLLNALGGNPDQKVRQASAAALGQIGDSRAVEPLLAQLQASDRELRAAVAQALGQLRDERAVAPLVALLRDTDRDTREAAANALDRLNWHPAKGETEVAYWAAKRWWSKCVEFGGLAVGPLAAALSDEPYGVAEALEKIGEPAVETLINGLQSSNRDVRRATAKALGSMSNVRAVEPLSSLLQDTDSKLRQIVARALGQLGDKRAVEPLIAVLREIEKSAHLAMAEAHFLSPTAIRREAHTEKDVRQAVVEALGKLDDNRAIEPLTSALRDVELRDIAVKGLKRLDDTKVVDALMPVLQDTDANVRRAAMEILGAIGDGRAVAPLISVLQDADGGLRQAAAKSLGSLGDMRAVEPLLALLQDPEAGVRLAVIEALGQLKDARAVEPLVQTLGGPDKEARSAVIEALARLGVLAVQPLLVALRDASRRPVAMEALKKVGAPAVHPLIAALQDPDAGTRRAAIETLGRLKDVRATVALIPLLQDPEMGIRRVTIDTLGQLGDARAVEPLTAALKDEALRYYAAEALWKVGAPPALRSLIQVFKENEQGAMLSQLRELCEAYAKEQTEVIARLEPQVVQIGEELNRRGGVEEMRALFELVGDQRGNRSLVQLWVGIGDWQAT